MSEISHKPYYLTTPIYYPSCKLTLGNSYTTVVSDVLARYHRLLGEDVFFLTGMDEHGQKIQRTAEAAGMEPQAYLDIQAEEIRALWKLLNISYDGFIRTTDEHHVQAVQTIFERLYEQGDIYESDYEGWYCTPCEAYWTESQASEGVCPDCNRALEWTKERSYFFRLSKYGPKILEYFKSHPDFLQPTSRMNELITNFLEPGLEDIAVTRSSFDWGVPVPIDPGHVVYVWIDALSNYISALGYPEAETDPAGNFKKFWPCDVHLVGKDISRFHALYWPAILMALGLELPKQIFAHGWLLMEGGVKMSKSKGNVVYAQDLCERYGVDCVRYYLMREIPFGMDGRFSDRSFLERLNADLANDLGNLLSRSTAMLSKYFSGRLPEAREPEAIDEDWKTVLSVSMADYRRAMEGLHFNQALAALWRFISRSNKYIDETMPWILAKDESKRNRLASVLANLFESLRQSAIALLPFMPDSATKILSAIGISLDSEAEIAAFAKLGTYENFETSVKIEAAQPLFPRIDIDAELASLEDENMSSEAAVSVSCKTTSTAEEATEPPVSKAEIAFEDFEKLHLCIGRVRACEKVKDADRLLKSTLELSSGREVTVVSGIAEHYSPEEMLGKQVLYLENLKPRKIRGVLSQGMLLCAEDGDGRLVLLRPESDVDNGSEVG
ncbi:MAG: methionine--tRNA ligase [Eubacteriales bacterium]|nr:methionine--tRNA ligase [Eubacteriales bacterium]